LLPFGALKINSTGSSNYLNRTGKLNVNVTNDLALNKLAREDYLANENLFKNNDDVTK
jgi:hypothetical protein